jgi:hypothetical protein
MVELADSHSIDKWERSPHGDWSTIGSFGGCHMVKLAHIVNPLVVGNPDSDLRYAQPVTIRSMRLARDHAARTAEIGVTQYAAFYEEDRAAVPEDFLVTPVLERSVLDCVEPAARTGGRKLPLLRDILDRLHAAAPDADYLIYTNIDIGLWPDFYVEVARRIQSGCDAFMIGRRTLGTEFTAPEDLDRILAQEGKPHFGFSCFVFPRDHYPDYLLGDTCIGLQPIGVTLAVNMIQRARRFEIFSRDRLTFHLGDDRVWERTLLDPLHLHNERTLDQVIAQLRHEGLAQRAAQIMTDYQRWRCRYVIDRTPRGMLRNLYRALRKMGLDAWVAARYDRFG